EEAAGGVGVAVTVARGLAVGRVAVGPGHEDALGDQRLLAAGEVLRHLDQGVEPRVGERLDLAEQDRRLGEADLGDAGGLALAGEPALLGLGLGGDDGLLGLAAGALQLGLGGDDHLLGLLAGPGQVGLGRLAGLGQVGLALVF